MNSHTLLTLAFLLLLAREVAPAQTASKMLPFQGRLTDHNGVGVSNGVRLVQFKIFEVPSGGSPVWAGELHRTTVNGGLVNVLLGSKTPFTSVDFDRQLYLEITVDINGDNAITAADPPMLPRQVILPVVFAKESADSRKLAGYDWSPLFGVNNPVVGRIDGAKLADASVFGSKVGDGQIQDRHVGIISKLSAPDGEPSPSLSVDNGGNVGIGTNQPESKLHVIGEITASSVSVINGVVARGPTFGEFAYSGGYREGTFQNWLGSGTDASCVRLMGAEGERAGGFGEARGPSIASPIIWFYAFEDRNCFQVRSVNYDFGAQRVGTVPDGTPLLTVRRIGGGARVGIGIENPASALDVAGQGRASSGFVNSSDRNVKRDFASVDCREVLDRLNSIPIRTWCYTNDPVKSRHIGPVSQDFKEAFRVGDDKNISTVDSAGVAFAAIQGLSRVMKEEDDRIVEEVRVMQARKDEEIWILKDQIVKLRQDLEVAIKALHNERR